jgi:tetratricopeptide (TPR) repeat protein
VPAEIGMVLMHYRQPSKALPRFRAAIELEPEAAFLWLRRAECEEALGLPDAARQSLRRCLELAPGHPDADRRLVALDNRPGVFGKLLKFLGG